ncbi:MAG: sulfurtransferase [Burkholderiales bacterium]|nr:sulfurtransferase [Burkholderiales bacterium]
MSIEVDTPPMADFLTPAALKHRLEAPDELALIDVSEEGEFGMGHLLRAVNVPYSRLELLIRPLVPRLDCPIVLVDQSNAVTARAARRLEALGYRNLSVLQGGTEAWAAAGFELFRGVYVPSKAFGEWVEHAFDTPSIDAHTLSALLAQGEDIAVLDPRTVAEHAARHIPTAIACPGAELLYRFRDLVPSRDTLVVVACGGRTRGIMGAQSLITAGVPNRVVALADGNHGWTLAGFDMEQGLERHYGTASEHGAAWARERADALLHKFQLPTVDLRTLAQWQQADATRTTFTFDVRSPEEYRAGHLAGARSAPGGQLIQATDQWMGTLGARVVLVDDDGVRAVLVAYWLTLMGWDAHVLRDEAHAPARAAGRHAPQAAHAQSPDAAAQVIRESQPAPVRAAEIDPHAAAARLAQGALAVSVDSSTDYLAGHPPGALWANRSRLDGVATAAAGRAVLLFSADGESAHLAAADLAERVDSATGIAVVRGGLQAWKAAGLPIESAPEERLTQDERVDTLFWAHDRRRGNPEAMRAYLEWEKNLLSQVAADGFRFAARAPGAAAPQTTNG